MAAFTINVQDQAVQSALKNLVDAGQNLSPVLKALGEQMVSDAKSRFASSTGPDGHPWAANAEATVVRLLQKTGGNFKKDGSLSIKGVRRVVGKKPLVGESRALSSTLHYSVADNTLTVGSPMPYAAMQQFGGKRSEFPWLWGDIPARPFLPVTPTGDLYPAERDRIVAMLQSFLQNAAS